MEKLPHAKENYLKTIYQMCLNNTTVRVSDVAAKMGVSKATVSNATDFLSNKGLVRKHRHRGLSLTAEGIKQAELISNKYTIIQTFLNVVLGIDPAIAEKDACSFEHCMSFESFQSICKYLEGRDQL